jgi:TolB-like protein
MAGEIFISYRRADEAWARLLHAQLRAEGVEAWYDALVGAGQDWRLATAKALEASEIFVLLFSENAAQSSDIAKELAAATLEEKLIIPIRLQNIAPKGAFLYELASRNWINAYENTEAKLGEVSKGLAHLVRTGARDASVLPFDHSTHGGQSRTARPKNLHRAMSLAAAALVAIAALLWFHAKPAAVVTSAPQSAGAAGASVAVLPLVNLSSDPKDGFFSDGMTEEITTALAKIPNLPVVGRTSAFQFKGKAEDLRAIGRALNATYLLEGSVRKDGDRVRIAAQLIKAATGDHVWAESYDRHLTDIFVVQEDVAKAIAAALRVPLGLKQGEALVNNRQIDSASYENYLRAAAIVRNRGSASGPLLNSSFALLEEVVARQPDYAPAWASLANAYSLWPFYDPAYQQDSAEDLRRVAVEHLAKAEAAARRAIQLDPRNAIAYTALGRLQGDQGKWLASEQSLKQALDLDPLNPEALHTYSLFLAATGQIKQAVAMLDKLLALDPLAPSYNASAVIIRLSAGENEKALTLAETVAGPTARVKAFAAIRRFKDAAASIQNAPPGQYPERSATATRLLRMAPSPAPRQETPYLGQLSVVYLYVGMPERALDVMERDAEAGFRTFSTLVSIWQPDFGPARKTERFKTLIRNLQFLDYWRARGWPQYCHPVGADGFACD